MLLLLQPFAHLEQTNARSRVTAAVEESVETLVFKDLPSRQLQTSIKLLTESTIHMELGPIP